MALGFRARNSCLQTRKMRVEIQFCELKTLALEKSCEFNISAKTKLLSWSQVKCSGNRIKHLRTQTLCHILFDFVLLSSAQVSSANHSDVNFLFFINNYTCYLHFRPGLVRLEVLPFKSIYYQLNQFVISFIIKPGETEERKTSD